MTLKLKMRIGLALLSLLAGATANAKSTSIPESYPLTTSQLSIDCWASNGVRVQSSNSDAAKATWGLMSRQFHLEAETGINEKVTYTHLILKRADQSATQPEQIDRSFEIYLWGTPTETKVTLMYGTIGYKSAGTSAWINSQVFPDGFLPIGSISCQVQKQ